MRKLINLRLSALLWVCLIAMCGSTPIMAQFDEPSRNQWFIEASVGAGTDPEVPMITYDPGYAESQIFEDKYGHNSIKFGISFGLNRRLFHNFYAGVRIGYKYAEYGTEEFRVKKGGYSSDWVSLDLSYHTFNLPIEIGYNHTMSNRSGLNIYASVQPGYCVGSISKVSDGPRSYFSISNPGFCADSSAGLRYFIRHVSVGVATHFPLNDAQKNTGQEIFEFSLGYRF